MEMQPETMTLFQWLNVEEYRYVKKVQNILKTLRHFFGDEEIV